MAFRLPNGSTVDFAATYGADVTITAISNANPAVVSAAGHTYEEGDIVVITSGWVRLTGRAFRVGTATAGTTFTLEDLDTTDTSRYPVGTSAGSVKDVATWVGIPQITSATSSGGEQGFYTFGFLQESTDRQLPTTKSPSVLTLVVADDPDQPYVPVIERADETQSETVQRLNLVDGSIILYVSVASITRTPSLTRNEIMTRTISMAQQGDISRYKKKA